MKIYGQPLYDRLVIKRIETGNRMYAGRVHMPDTAISKSYVGEVLAVGCGYRLSDGQLSPLIVRVGDRVRFAQHAGHEYKVDDEEYLIIREEDVLVILPPVESVN